MTDLFDAALEVDLVLGEIGLPFCFIGGLAIQHWGEPRATRDVDVSVLTRFENEPEVVDKILARLPPRIPGAREHALQYRVILASTRSGVGVDVGLAGFEYEEGLIARSTKIDFLEGVRLRTISAEDLVVMKAFAGRELDWRDVSGIIARQRDKLRWPLIESLLVPLLEAKEAPEDLERLRALKRDVEQKIASWPYQ